VLCSLSLAPRRSGGSCLAPHPTGPVDLACTDGRSSSAGELSTRLAESVTALDHSPGPQVQRPGHAAGRRWLSHLSRGKTELAGVQRLLTGWIQQQRTILCKSRGALLHGALVSASSQRGPYAGVSRLRLSCAAPPTAVTTDTTPMEEARAVTAGTLTKVLTPPDCRLVSSALLGRRQLMASAVLTTTAAGCCRPPRSPPPSSALRLSSRTLSSSAVPLRLTALRCPRRLRGCALRGAPRRSPWPATAHTEVAMECRRP